MRLWLVRCANLLIFAYFPGIWPRISPRPSEMSVPRAIQACSHALRCLGQLPVHLDRSERLSSARCAPNRGHFQYLEYSPLRCCSAPTRPPQASATCRPSCTQRAPAPQHAHMVESSPPAILTDGGGTPLQHTMAHYSAVYRAGPTSPPDRLRSS